MNIKDDEKIEQEYENLRIRNEERIREMSEHIDSFKNIESEFKNSNIDWSNLANKIKDYEETKRSVEYFNKIKKFNEIIELNLNTINCNNLTIEELDKNLSLVHDTVIKINLNIIFQFLI